jgi:hypothetical protein
MATQAPNYRLQFLSLTVDDQRGTVLEERPLRAASADDAAREAAFGGWPGGANVCRIADLAGKEVASVARFA